MEKLKAGIFDGFQIRELMKEPMFEEELSEAELSTTNFLRKHRSAEYEKVIQEILKSFRQLGVWISFKLYFLWSHLYYFLKSCGDLSEEQGDRFYQKIGIMEERYQGRRDVNFLADYCWCLKRDAVATEHRKKSLKIHFIHEYLLWYEP